jgi:Gpi18-like mannosyltransferase
MLNFSAVAQRATALQPLASALDRKASRIALVALIGAVAIAVRVAMFHYQSGDYVEFLQHWYQYIDANGGFRALKDPSFSNYNVPYLYLLALLTYLPVPPLVGI